MEMEMMGGGGGEWWLVVGGGGRWWNLWIQKVFDLQGSHPKGFCIFGSKRFSYLLYKMAGNTITHSFTLTLTLPIHTIDIKSTDIQDNYCQQHWSM